MSRKIIDIPATDIKPSKASIFKGLGIAQNEEPGARAVLLVDEAIRSLLSIIKPIGIISEISKGEFANIYEGDGRNEPDSPLGRIFGACDDLAAFVVTLGEGISNEIRDRFKFGDLALASMLDSAASEAAEMAARTFESYYRSHSIKAGKLTAAAGTMRFSPGYCGWHISAQKRLLAFLRTEEIGITLTDTFLMQPLKSISGVILSGRKDIFLFDDDFSFCSDCATHSCRERMTEIFNQIEET